MCSQYWNLNARLACPDCGKSRMWEIQSHFMGDFGSCMNHYKLGEKVKELEDTTITLDGKVDDFIGHCPNCGKLFDVGGEIVDGKVKRVFILQQAILYNLDKIKTIKRFKP